jgi:hypothetical protein
MSLNLGSVLYDFLAYSASDILLKIKQDGIKIDNIKVIENLVASSAYELVFKDALIKIFGKFVSQLSTQYVEELVKFFAQGTMLYITQMLVDGKPEFSHIVFKQILAQASVYVARMAKM